MKYWLLSYIFFSTAAQATDWSKIPVRFDATVLAMPAKINFEGYDSYGYSGYGIGADLELLMPGIHSLIGVSGLVSADVRNKDFVDTLSIGSAYLGVIFKSVDLLFGPSWGIVYRRVKAPYSAPNDQAEYTAIMPGGFLGLRRNLTSSNFLGLSIALKGFYLTASEYEMELKNGSSITKTDVKKDAVAYGGWIELMFAIGGKSKHDGWGWGLGGL